MYKVKKILTWYEFIEVKEAILKQPQNVEYCDFSSVIKESEYFQHSSYA